MLLVKLLTLLAIVIGGMWFLYDLGCHNYGAPESGAAGDARNVGSAQAAYAATNGGYFGRPGCLGAPKGCGFPSETPPFIDAQLASLSTKQGYIRSFVPGPSGEGKPDPGITRFVYVATPAQPWLYSGRFFGYPPHRLRGFAIDHTGLVCYTTDGSAPPIVDAALSPSCTPLK